MHCSLAFTIIIKDDPQSTPPPLPTSPHMIRDNKESIHQAGTKSPSKLASKVSSASATATAKTPTPTFQYNHREDKINMAVESIFSPISIDSIKKQRGVGGGARKDGGFVVEAVAADSSTLEPLKPCPKLDLPLLPGSSEEDHFLFYPSDVACNNPESDDLHDADLNQNNKSSPGPKIPSSRSISIIKDSSSIGKFHHNDAVIPNPH